MFWTASRVFFIFQQIASFWHVLYLYSPHIGWFVVAPEGELLQMQVAPHGEIHLSLNNGAHGAWAQFESAKKKELPRVHFLLQHDILRANIVWLVFPADCDNQLKSETSTRTEVKWGVHKCPQCRRKKSLEEGQLKAKEPAQISITT